MSEMLVLLKASGSGLGIVQGVAQVKMGMQLLYSIL